jgi:hypothetical protein
MNKYLLLITCFCSCLWTDAAERVRVSCDRSLYAAGETIWLRGWVTEAGSPAGEVGEMPTSKFLYVELLRDGLGSVEQRIKLKERGGMFFGQMPLDDGLESGWYTLRAYTRAQKDWPAESLFHTRLLIRGAGPVQSLYEARQVSGAGAPDIKVDLAETEDGHLSVTLTDEDGNPVIGNFALSVTKGSYADFDFQTAPVPVGVDEKLLEGDREYTQELDFRVKSVRNRLPDQYHVAIMSQDIGYYYSTDVPGDRAIKGEEGQSFRIPDLDYPEETLFSVNVTGSKFLYPAMENDEAAFASPFDYGPTYPAREIIRDTAAIRERFEGTVAPLPADDTISASRITAERKPAFYKPSRLVGPYSNVFEWRQVKLREELQKWDDMDLMAYISAHFAGLVTTWGQAGLRIGRTMYTTRDGTISSRVTVTHGQAKYNNKAGYRPVALYIDGMREPDWERAAIMTVREVQNLYVLRGTEAALYSAAAVVLLELRHFDEKMLEEKKNERKTTIALLPLGWQQPKAFDAAPALNPDRQGTLYWNPCIRTDAAGQAVVTLPELPEGGAYLRLEGQTLDGRWFMFSK